MSKRTIIGRSGSRNARAYHHGHLKEKLLEAAERLLERDGVAGLSLRAVARAAGVSHAAPYRHFRDKNGLLSALAVTGFDRLSIEMDRARARHASDPAAGLIAAGRAYVRLAVASPALTTLMFGGMPPDAVCENCQQAGDRAFGTLISIVENGRRAGIYRKTDSQTLSVAAWSAMHGLATLFSSQSLAEATRSRRASDELASAVGELMLHGMLKR